MGAFGAHARMQRKFTRQSKVDGTLVSTARKPALNSQGMFSEPGTHLLIRPGPFKGMGVPMVIFWPRSQDMCLELLLTLPGCPFQVVVLERVNEDFRLVQPG